MAVSLPKPVKWINGRLLVLDQRLLPEKEKYISCQTPIDVYHCIKNMAIRGAPLIGITAAYGMALCNSSNIAKISQLFISARPTAVNLKWAVIRMLNAIKSGKDSLSEAISIHNEDRLFCDLIGKHGSRLVPPNANIITICNTGFLATGGCGTAFSVIFKSRTKKPHIYVLETRPLLQGARLTMWELQEASIRSTLICDSAAAHLMQRKKINLILTGADRIALNGDTANKIGTLALAITAKEFRIPFYVCAPASTFDQKIKSGLQIPIEERSPTEINGRFRSLNPAFDVTPNKYITAFITNKGVINPSALRPKGRSMLRVDTEQL